MNRGFDRAFGSGGGGNYFALTPLYLDRENIKAGENFYATDAFTDNAVKFLEAILSSRSLATCVRCFATRSRTR